MAVTEVLILIPLIWLGWIILTVSILRIGSEDRGPLVEIQSDVALETDRETAIGAGRKEDRAAAGRGGRINCPVDRRRVHCLAVALCAKLLHIENTGGSVRRCSSSAGSSPDICLAL